MFSFNCSKRKLALWESMLQLVSSRLTSIIELIRSASNAMFVRLFRLRLRMEISPFETLMISQIKGMQF